MACTGTDGSMKTVMAVMIQIPALNIVEKSGVNMMD